MEVLFERRTGNVAQRLSSFERTAMATANASRKKFYNPTLQRAGVPSEYACPPCKYNYGQQKGEPWGWQAFIEFLVRWSLVFMGLLFCRPVANFLMPAKYAEPSFVEDFVFHWLWLYQLGWIGVASILAHTLQSQQQNVRDIWGNFLLPFLIKPLIGMVIGFVVWYFFLPDSWFDNSPSWIGGFSILDALGLTHSNIVRPVQTLNEWWGGFIRPIVQVVADGLSRLIH